MSDNELKELKASVNIVDVINQFTPLEKRGRLYVGLCLFHNDTSVGSFKVNPKKGTYNCYSCGAQGDVISFITNMGQTFKEAVAVLKGEKELEGANIEINSVENSCKKAVQLAEFEYIRPLDEVKPRHFVHGKFGAPAFTYTYKDLEGDLVGYVLRYEFDGKKYILPYNYGICVEAGWQYDNNGKGAGTFYNLGDIIHKYLGFGDNTPIYGAEKIKKYPKANILIVEGEKTCDFIQERYDPNKVICISWQGGTNKVMNVDWSVLDGRRVFLWPDNDWSHTDQFGAIKEYIEQPSPKAFNHINNELKKLDCERTWIRFKNPEDHPCGWDSADSNWDASEITQFILENSWKLNK